MKCPIENITVYNDRAEVIRRVEVELEKGQYALSITGVSSELTPNSVHVSGGTGLATILEVSTMTTYDEIADTLTGAEISAKKEAKTKLEKVKKGLQKKMEIISKNQEWLEHWAANVNATPQIQAKHAEKEFLNDAYFGSISSFMGFYTQQLSTLMQNRTDLETEIEELDTRLKILDLEINQASHPKRKPKEQRNTITVNLIAGGGQVILQLSYVVNNARWAPSYDCRVDSGSSKLQLTYYGVITNSTGEDWVDAHLSLSTATPDIGGAPPELPTSTVGVRPAYSYQAKARRTSVSRDEMLCVQSTAFAISEREESFNVPPPPISTLVTTASETAACATFTIPVPSTIASDNKEHKVTIAIMPLETRFTYAVIPRVSPYSYLKSTTANTSQFFLLAGPCNVFMDNNFVATSSLKDVSPKEEFAFFLGTDKAVKVEYQIPTEVKDQAGILRRSNLQTWTGYVLIRNTKSKEIAVVAYEQVPKSNDERIKVTLLEPDIKKSDCNCKMNLSNNLEWRYHIKPGQSLKLTCKYTVESPADLTLTYTY